MSKNSLYFICVTSWLFSWTRFNCSHFVSCLLERTHNEMFINKKQTNTPESTSVHCYCTIKCSLFNQVRIPRIFAGTFSLRLWPQPHSPVMSHRQKCKKNPHFITKTTKWKESLLCSDSHSFIQIFLWWDSMKITTTTKEGLWPNLFKIQSTLDNPD